MNKIIYYLHRYIRSIKYDYHISPKRLLKQLLKTQYWSGDKRISFQLDELNKLLKYSYSSSIYYKKLYKNLDIHLRSIDKFSSKIPFVTKKNIQENFEELKTKSITNEFEHKTSGSTGDPLTIFISGIAEAYREAGFLRFLSWWAVRPYDKSVLIWGRKATKSNNYLFEKIKNKFRLRYDINVFELNDETIKDYFNDIRRFKPAYIRGYKSAIYQFAELLDNNNLIFENFKFKVAIVTSEVLFENEREYIQKILGCRVANEYGSAEAGQIAHECPNGSMHIFEEAVYLSTNIDNEVFLTELHNECMPLINYKNDDKVIISNNKCICGRTSRIISHLEGRVNDYIIKPDGNKISQYLFYYTIKELDDIGLDNCVLKYKLIQNKDKFQILIVPSKKYNEKVEEYIKTRLYEKIGKEIAIEFCLVDSIPRDKSGKLRFFTRIS